jgi:hypothetical protein
VAENIIQPTPTTFMSGRDILEGVDIFHEVVRINVKDIVLKLDFKKARDKVQWSFLKEL